MRDTRIKYYKAALSELVRAATVHANHHGCSGDLGARLQEARTLLAKGVPKPKKKAPRRNLFKESVAAFRASSLTPNAQAQPPSAEGAKVGLEPFVGRQLPEDEA